jgi:hypothetical protein
MLAPGKDKTIIMELSIYYVYGSHEAARQDKLESQHRDFVEKIKSNSLDLTEAIEQARSLPQEYYSAPLSCHCDFGSLRLADEITILAWVDRGIDKLIHRPGFWKLAECPTLGYAVVSLAVSILKSCKLWIQRATIAELLLLRNPQDNTHEPIYSRAYELICRTGAAKILLSSFTTREREQFVKQYSWVTSRLSASQ